MATRVESQPPGDVGLFSFDWTDALAAVGGDTLDGTPTITAAPVGLTISAIQQVEALTNFLASASVAGRYTISTRGVFTPSGRSISQSFVLSIGLPPAIEPVTLEDARAQLKLDASGTPATHPDDDLLLSLITAAREHAEHLCGRTLIATDVVDVRDTWWERYGDRRHRAMHFGRPHHAIGNAPIELTRSPVQSLSSVQYVGTDGVLATLDPSTYVAALDGKLRGGMSRIAPAIGSFWPSLALQPDAVQIAYVAGPKTAALEVVKRAILMLVTHWYEFRGPVISGSANEVDMTVADMLGPLNAPNV